MDSADATSDALPTHSALLVHLAEQLRTLADRAALAGDRGDLSAPLDLCDGRCALVRRYRAEVRGAIVVLEQTRTSFKSKELGALRRRLGEFLEQTAAGEPGGSNE